MIRLTMAMALWLIVAAFLLIMPGGAVWVAGSHFHIEADLGWVYIAGLFADIPAVYLGMHGFQLSLRNAGYFSRDKL